MCTCRTRNSWLFTTIILVLALAAAPGRADIDQARHILNETGVKGGLIVHIGCGDGRLTSALRANDSYIVHGLDRDPENVVAARKHIQTLGQYGNIFVELWSGERLPYIDNSVNLVVSEDLGEVSDAEVMRVLCPNGVAYTMEDGKWTKIVKSWPQEIDEWTHYLHDPSNNAVAHDSVIEPPSRYQWVAGPRYSRQHDHMSSVSAVVSANGRLFYIFDEATRASVLTPPKWRLIARDAFNGKLLWKRKIELWHPHLWRLKSGPQLLARRLVAVGDRVYITLGIDAPLSMLDAATGKTIRTYEGTKATEEILCFDDVLILSVAKEGQPLRSDPKKRYATLAELNKDVTNSLWTQAPRTIMAVDADSGKVLWEKKSRLLSLSLAANAQRVIFHNGEKIRCLDRRTGQSMWASEPLPNKETMRSSGGTTLVLYNDVVLYSGQVNITRPRERSTTMFALSIKDGRTLWQSPHHPCGHMGTPDDIIVAGGLVWNGAVAQGSDSGTMTGRDLYTGEVKNEFSPDVETHWFHHRCYRAKATDKYLLFSRTGIEFIDHAEKHWICHHWVRGACHYGIMPCNGLIYAPQHPCACYIEAKLYGFSAVAPPLSTALRYEEPENKRLTRGPAYRAQFRSRTSGSKSEEWPTFRHDAARSGAVKTTVQPTDMKCTWSSKVGGKLSTLVVADGKLFVASIDDHSVHALDVTTGEQVWNFKASGRIDSPPTIWRGRVLFGSADGHVYCLKASDGKLVWRYRGAPEDKRMMSFDQLESVWPVHGSVLVQNDVLYCVAGRSMFLDGGLRLLRLDPKTGRKLSETILDDKVPGTQENLQVHIQGLNMPVALPDILSCDGRYVYMRSLPFDLTGKRKFVTYVPVKEQQGDDLHLFCPTGFLDDSLWHRTYWGYGRAWASGAGGYHQAGRVIPAGRPLVFDDEKVYGYGRLWKYYRWTTPLEFHFFAAKKQPEIVKAGIERKAVKKGGKRVGTRKVPVTRFVPDWSNDVSVQINSMVLTENAIFAAGPPDLEDEEESVKTLLDPETQKKLAEQSAAFEGKRGALLVAVSRDNGEKLAAYRLGLVPRFDGLIAANGRLYVSTLSGEVLCLSSAQGQPLSPAEEVVVAARE
ncbi:MAG: outer membrane protein assembly factor BamB family protein [Planctomycetota bacterium]